MNRLLINVLILYLNGSRVQMVVRGNSSVSLVVIVT